MKHAPIQYILLAVTAVAQLVTVVAAEQATRLDAARDFAMAAAAKNQEAMTTAFMPLELGFDMMAASGHTMTDAEKTQMKSDYEKERDAMVATCFEKLGGQDASRFTFKDLEQSRFSEFEIEEIQASKMGSDHGDVMVSTPKGNHHFRIFRYKDNWYFVDFR